VLIERLVLQRAEGTLCAHVAIARHDLEPLRPLRWSMLDAAEQARFAAFVVPARQASYLLGRYVAKSAVAAHLGVGDLRQIHIAHGVFEQPMVRVAQGPGAQVTLSHSGPWGIAIAGPEAHPMGVDVERIEAFRRAGAGAPPWQTTRDAWLLGALDRPAPQRLALLWTIKEALSKVLKTGLMAGFEIFEINRIAAAAGRTFESEFTHFVQYKAVSWLFDEYAWSIVLPKRTTMPMDRVIEAQARTWPATHSEVVDR
jgi:phosphopantetheinyl transferase